MYDRAAAAYDVLHAARGKDYAAEAARVAALVRQRRPEACSLLDTACGTGGHLRWLRDHFEVVEGVDRSPAMLARARESAPGVPVHEGDLRTFDLGRRFDAVTCLFSSIAYLVPAGELRRGVANLARHLVDGGVLVVEPWAARPSAVRAAFDPLCGPKGAQTSVACGAVPELLRAEEARRLALRAQGLLGAPDRRAGVPGVLRRLGAVQLDTISVLARSHELVAYARLGPVGRAAVEAAYWGRPPSAFEYWSHAACVLPLEDWPWFAFRRRAWLERHDERATPAARREVLARLADGPATASDLGGARKGGPWWDWSDVKRAAEVLLREGTVVCVERRGWKRVYDLAERAVSADLLAAEPSDHRCRVALVRDAGRRLAVATREDLADFHRLRPAEVDAALPDAGLVAVEVQGWPAPAWGDPAALDELAAGGPRGRHRTTLLSPFDSLVWDRARTARLFGFVHRLEAYVPAPKRVHGYFTMPLLAGGRLVGRVDPARRGRTLVARKLSMAGPREVAPMAEALREAAIWVGGDAVGLERVDPPELAEPLRAALGPSP